MSFLYIFVKNNHCHLLFQTCGRSEEIEGQALTEDKKDLKPYFYTYVDNKVKLQR